MRFCGGRLAAAMWSARVVRCAAGTAGRPNTVGLAVRRMRLVNGFGRHWISAANNLLVGSGTYLKRMLRRAHVHGVVIDLRLWFALHPDATLTVDDVMYDPPAEVADVAGCKRCEFALTFSTDYNVMKAKTDAFNALVMRFQAAEFCHVLEELKIAGTEAAGTNIERLEAKSFDTYAKIISGDIDSILTIKDVADDDNDETDRRRADNEARAAGVAQVCSTQKRV